jgi:hypothetical protein
MRHSKMNKRERARAVNRLAESGKLQGKNADNLNDTEIQLLIAQLDNPEIKPTAKAVKDAVETSAPPVAQASITGFKDILDHIQVTTKEADENGKEKEIVIEVTMEQFLKDVVSEHTTRKNLQATNNVLQVRGQTITGYVMGLGREIQKLFPDLGAVKIPYKPRGKPEVEVNGWVGRYNQWIEELATAAKQAIAQAENIPLKDVKMGQHWADATSQTRRALILGHKIGEKETFNQIKVLNKSSETKKKLEQVEQASTLKSNQKTEVKASTASESLNVVMQDAKQALKDKAISETDYLHLDNFASISLAKLTMETRKKLADFIEKGKEVAKAA